MFSVKLLTMNVVVRMLERFSFPNRVLVGFSDQILTFSELIPSSD